MLHILILEVVLLSLGLCCCFAGIVGSLLPVMPGPPISWLGLLLFYLIPDVTIDYWFLGITLGIAVLIFILDYIIPIVGTKYFGGTRAGTIGSTIGLIAGLFFPPFGILIGPFLGAFFGEILFNINSNSKHALKSALGSFIGFIASTFMKFLVSIIYLGLFVYKLVENWAVVF